MLAISFFTLVGIVFKADGRVTLGLGLLPSWIQEVAQVAKGQGKAWRHQGRTRQRVVSLQNFLRRISYYIEVVKDRVAVL